MLKPLLSVEFLGTTAVIEYRNMLMQGHRIESDIRVPPLQPFSNFQNAEDVQR
jgi:hypothetical protein